MKQVEVKFPECNDSRACVAKKNGKCMALNSTYRKDGECPFCKVEKVRREVRR